MATLTLVLSLLSLGSAKLLIRPSESHFEKPEAIAAYEGGHSFTNISGVTGYSGLITVNSTSNASMFYWLTEKLGTNISTDNSPLIMWLQGGPGCSSATGNLFEFGPLYIDNNLTPQRRNVTWASNYHLLFVDNPYGAGYSWAPLAEYVTNHTQMADNLYKMLTSLQRQYPAWFTRKFYIFGESYGGHWVPAIADKIINKNNKGHTAITLDGIGIVDGWTDPIHQLKGYASFAYDVGLVDDKTRDYIENAETLAREFIKAGNYEAAHVLFDNNITQHISDISGGFNLYNYREYQNYDSTAIDDWLNLNRTKHLLHVPTGITFNDCDDYAYQQLYSDFMVSVRGLFPDILNNTRVLLVNGQDDYIVNVHTAHSWIDTIDWGVYANFTKVDKFPWYVDNNYVGWGRHIGNLTQVIVNKAGHMAPKDQTYNTLKMVDLFVNHDI
jgi:carboxypeptidase C (cathepsin A)